jgi:hypothetical protein
MAQQEGGRAGRWDRLRTTSLLLLAHGPRMPPYCTEQAVCFSSEGQRLLGLTLDGTEEANE